LALRVRELEGFPARLLGSLPSPTTVMLEACLGSISPSGEIPRESVLVVVTTCAEDYATARKRRYVTLHGAEFAAVTLAAELDRATPAVFEGWCELKQRPAEAWELTPQVTLGAFISRHDQRALSVGEVLRACGASILNVACGAPAPPDFWR
jgi:hypothetical protein